MGKNDMYTAVPITTSISISKKNWNAFKTLCGMERRAVSGWLGLLVENLVKENQDRIDAFEKEKKAEAEGDNGA